MIYKNEKSLINIMKYTPLIFIISISLIIAIFLYIEKQITFKEEKNLTNKTFIKTNKEDIKNQVDNLHEFILKTQKQTEKKLKENIKAKVYEANNIAMRIYNENKDTKTKDEIIKMIKDALVDIRFNNGRGYFFIYSFDYECILLPIARKLEGTNFYDFKDGEGTYLTRKIIEQMKKDKEGFLSWVYHKPEDYRQYKKIGFNIYFEPYDWFIGTGEYFVDYENDVKNEVLEYISRISQNNKDYFFILDYEGKTLFHIEKELINQPATKVTNLEKRRTLDDMIVVAKEGEGFLTYSHKYGINEEFSTKTSYVKGLDNWEWVIGKGFYQDDVDEILMKKGMAIDKEFERRISNIFAIVLAFAIVLLIISIIISKKLEKKFADYKFEINKYIKENNKQQIILSQQSKINAMGEMLGNIAHQWRQPLSVITTVATGMKLQKEFGKLDDQKFNDSIDNITNSALYLSKTIDDFKSFFKSDKQETLFSIEKTFEEVFKVLNAQFKEHEIIFIKEINDFMIFGFENEFVQALINILNNAKDALIGKKAPRLIFINTMIDKDKYVIKIKDNGGGINEEILDKIFEPYFTTKHQSIGTGIGLYMTEEIIVKHMKGILEINNKNIIHQNKEYKGVEVTIKLDIKPY